MALTNLPVEPKTEKRSGDFRGNTVTVATANAGRLRLDPLTADPADAANGDIWYRDDLKKYRVRENGVNLTITAA